MRKLSKRGLAVVFVAVATLTMSVAMALPAPKIQDAVATMSAVLGAPTGGPLDLTHVCTGGDGDDYVTTKAKSSAGDAMASSDTELAGPIVMTAKLTSDADVTTPAGPQGEGVATGAITISPTAFPGTRWSGPFTSVIQVIDANNNAIGRGFINAAHQKYNKATHKWVGDGKRLITNVVETVSPITTGPNAGKFQLSASFGSRSTPDGSGTPVLGAKIIGACP